MKPRRRITLALLLIPMLFPPPSWGNGEQKKAAAETLPPWQAGEMQPSSSCLTVPACCSTLERHWRSRKFRLQPNQMSQCVQANG